MDLITISRQTSLFACLQSTQGQQQKGIEIGWKKISKWFCQAKRNALLPDCHQSTLGQELGIIHIVSGDKSRCSNKCIPQPGMQSAKTNLALRMRIAMLWDYVGWSGVFISLSLFETMPNHLHLIFLECQTNLFRVIKDMISGYWYT